MVRSPRCDGPRVNGSVCARLPILHLTLSLLPQALLKPARSSAVLPSDKCVSVVLLLRRHTCLSAVHQVHCISSRTPTITKIKTAFGSSAEAG